MAIPNWRQTVSWKHPVLPPPPIRLHRKLPPSPNHKLSFGNDLLRQSLKSFSVCWIFFFFFLCFLAVGLILFILLFPCCSSKSFFFPFFWSRNGSCHSSRDLERGVYVCVWLGGGFSGLTSFLQIHSKFQKYIQKEASSSRSLLLLSLSSRCLKQPRWSRCCVSAQPLVSRSQHMIRSTKPEKQQREKLPAGNLKVNVPEAFYCCKAPLNPVTFFSFFTCFSSHFSV